MLALKCPKQAAQKTKQMLTAKKLLSQDCKVTSDKLFVYFPITKKLKSEHEIVEIKQVPLKKRDTKLKSAVEKGLTKEELAKLKTAFDLVGDIAILEVDESLIPKEGLISQTLMSINKNIKTVLKKAGGHEGSFRTQKMAFLAGIDKRETIHRENNVRLKLDVENVYFSPRLSTERKRVYEMIKPGENVLVMFSGCGPYTCVISKNTKAAKVIGIELNPDGHRYAVENIKLNKLKNAEAHLGDVVEKVPEIVQEHGKFDRILMPMPKGGDAYLDIALSAANKKATVHFYDFLAENEFDEAIGKIKEACKAAGRKCKILRKIKCGQQSPRVFRVCVDFEVC
jgi:tRNA (guanine37-N1)-methyltransferase